jgi:hypothetical protein
MEAPLAEEKTDKPRVRREDVERVVQLTLDNWEEIGVQESPDHILHLPATIKRRNAKGGVVEEPVLLRNVSNPQRFKARTAARAWALELELDLDRDRALVDELENYCILAYAIRDREFIQHFPDAKELFKTYGVQALGELWGAYDAWVRMLHPSFGTWDGEKLWKVIAKVRAGATLAPLAVLPGIEQASCVLFMAREAALSPNAPSWLASSAISTRAP